MKALWRAALILGLSTWAGLAHAEPRHGLSAFGDLKYPADFKHFDYVNPDAPKGGSMRTTSVYATRSFDSFNPFILLGDSPSEVSLTYDSLMAGAADEPDSVYGLVARTADLLPDGKGVVFALRPEARFADGTSLTARDVCFSFDLLKKSGHPNIQASIRGATSCTAPDATTVRFAFDAEPSRTLPLVLAALPILSQAYYTTHDFTKSSLDKPLGSGPYEIGTFDQGKYVSFKRRPDYWARDLPVNRGRNNFDELRFDYYLDSSVALEALKKGDLDLREEFSSRAWAKDYSGLRSIEEGRLIKETLVDGTPSGAQGFFINMRRAPFKDRRVREALGLAFDYEWTNRNLFYGAYKRTASMFENSPLKAEGAPDAAELAMLEPWRASLQPEAFGPAVLPPVSDGSGRDRAMLRKASQLLTEAGWKLEGTRRVNAKGEPLKLTILNDDSLMERVYLPYINTLKSLGIEASLRNVDSAQYQRLQEDYDYDMISARFVSSLTPGPEVALFFGSKEADTKGTYNFSGIKNPGIDGLIANLGAQKTRADLIVAAHALDRALRAEYFWVPAWHGGIHRLAWWNQYGRPATKPAFDRGILDTWWTDPLKAQTLKRGN